ncbi:MAG: hypothetical protein OJF59_002522 [Cytophagales bacterium]|jgi:hypothetical protein|nr:hypothetical protein [Bacteroidota bacterium]MBS1980244.1 hypothetical protein [Bacteroidota bacterium]WHZ08768.1 MAG: hypothetical protein OJF59_002522 [Cytophagales bacterium]
MGLIQFFEDNTGALAIGHQAIAKLTDITLDFTTATDETTSFTNQYQAEFQPTKRSWSMDCTAFCTSVTTGTSFYSGGTSAGSITGVTNGLLLMETFKAGQPVNIVLKLENSNVQRAYNCVMTSCSVKAQTAKAMTFSLKIQGTGSLVKSTS